MLRGTTPQVSLFQDYRIHQRPLRLRQNALYTSSFLSPRFGARTANSLSLSRLITPQRRLLQWVPKVIHIAANDVPDSENQSLFCLSSGILSSQLHHTGMNSEFNYRWEGAAQHPPLAPVKPEPWMPLGQP